MNSIYYILSPQYSLRGWKRLPYAVQHLYQPGTVFMREHEWQLLKACDGHTGIAPDLLSDDDIALYEKWEKSGIIRRSSGCEDLLPVQEYRFYGARFKEEVQWSVTGRCNLHCRHCFMSAPHSAQGEPSWEQLMQILDAFERCGIKGISLTGGEPLVRSDFLKLAEEITRRGMVITVIYSNGMLVSDGILDSLEARGIYPAFQFSFDGVGHHDWLRGTDGAEKAVLSAMKRCKERGLRFGASMVLFRENRNSISDTVRLLSECGCSYIKIGGAFAQGEWKNEPAHWLTRPEIYETFLAYIPVFFAEDKPVSLDLEGFFNYDKQRDTVGSFFDRQASEDRFGSTLICGHVRRTLYVSPGGNVLPCMPMAGTPAEDRFPNMLETPLEEILDGDSLYMRISDQRVSDLMAHDPECAVCEYRSDCCGGCRAQAMRSHPDDSLARDEVTCEYFKGGWKKKKDELLRRLCQRG